MRSSVTVILPPAQYGFWLDRKNEDVEALSQLLVAAPAQSLEAIEVSKRVNNARNDDTDLVKPSPLKRGEGGA